VQSLCDAKEKLKLSTDGGDSGSKKRKQGYHGAYGGVWRSLLFAGFWSQAVGFVLVISTVAVKMFSHLIYFAHKFYKLRTSNAIFKDLPLNTKTVPFPSNLRAQNCCST
jgi:hypothetical protein